MAKGKINKNFIFLLLMALVLIITAVFFVMYLRTDPIADVLKNDQMLKTLIVLKNDDEENPRLLFTTALLYYPVSRRVAMFDIPENMGAIYESLGRTDSIEAVYLEKGIDVYRKEIEKRRDQERKQRRIEKEKEAAAGKMTIRQMRLMSLALVLRVLPQDRARAIMTNFDEGDNQLITNYMSMANLESMIDGDILLSCLKEMKDYMPVSRKLSQENVMSSLLRLYKANARERIEKVIKNERPLVKRFISQAYEGEYSGLPLKVADIVAHYVEDSI